MPGLFLITPFESRNHTILVRSSTQLVVSHDGLIVSPNVHVAPILLLFLLLRSRADWWEVLCFQHHLFVLTLENYTLVETSTLNLHLFRDLGPSSKCRLSAHIFNEIGKRKHKSVVACVCSNYLPLLVFKLLLNLLLCDDQGDFVGIWNDGEVVHKTSRQMLRSMR